MFYITGKDSLTGKKLKVVDEKMKVAHAAQKKFATKYKITEYRGADVVSKGKGVVFVVFGGISSVIFKKEPDIKVWKNVNGRKNEWMPRKNVAAGKEIQKEIDNLPVVTVTELNDVVGFKGSFNAHIGFQRNNLYYYGFTTRNKWKLSISDDCIEVTETEYRKIFQLN